MSEHSKRSSAVSDALGVRLKSRQAALQAAEKTTDLLGNIRLGMVAVAIALVFLPAYTRNAGPWWALIVLGIGFVGLGVRQDRAFDMRRRLTASVRYYQESLSRLNETWRTDVADTGDDLTEGRAGYASDLDLYGPASLFQLLSRAATAPGRRTLAAWLDGGATLEQIQGRQVAAQELAEAIDYRESFVTASAGEDHRPAEDAAVIEWAETAPPLPMPGLLTALGALVPLLTAAGIAVYLVTDMGWPMMLALAIHAATLIGTRILIASRIEVLGGPERVLMRYARLITAVESRPAESPLLKDILHRLETNGVPAAKQIARLQTLVNLLDARLNMFFALSVGPATLWELNVVLRTERWRRTTGPRLGGWFEAIGELEALASFGAMAYERSDYSFPEVFDGKPTFEAQQLSHPLIHRGNVVANDLTLGGPGSVLLLSGSNMSGKSTLLRSVGLAIVMAEAGGPVPSEGLKLSRMRLATSVRIVDSLAHGTSHFYAELARLKYIVDEAQTSEPPLLYLLDEVLHGTNSRERYIGAVSVIRWLSQTGAMGIVTTHDLALAKVADTLEQGKATNRHFSDEVRGDEIFFDYSLRDGAVKSTNALRLMKAIGIDVELVDEES